MSDPDMQLPEGMTCSDCLSFRRCVGLFGCKPEAKTCDWAPSRFVADARPIQAKLDAARAALAVAEGENTKLRETLANVYKVPGVISAVGDHVEKARNGGSENGSNEAPREVWITFSEQPEGLTFGAGHCYIATWHQLDSTRYVRADLVPSVPPVGERERLEKELLRRFAPANLSAHAAEAPCISCGYNGAGYWQSGTHHPGCVVRDIGGLDERIAAYRAILSSPAPDPASEPRAIECRSTCARAGCQNLRPHWCSSCGEVDNWEDHYKFHGYCSDDCRAADEAPPFGAVR